MTPPTLKQLIEKATPGPWQTLDGSLVKVAAPNMAERRKAKRVCGVGESEDAQWDLEMQATGQLIARCSPSVMLAVVEALIDAHLYIDDGLEGSPAKRKAMLLQIESALNLLNGKAP